MGYGGLLSLAHAAFYGIGAYLSALLALRAGWGFVPALVLAILGAVLASLVVAYPSLRLRGDYFLLATLAFQTIVYAVLYNAVEWTEGPMGLRGVPPPEIFGVAFDTLGAQFLLTSAVTITVVLAVAWLGSSPFGRALRALRDDELAARALGKDIVGLKVWAFALSGALAAVAGALYAAYVGFIDPTSFQLADSIYVLGLVLLGGSGNLRGPILGAVMMQALPELLRFAGIPDTVAPYLQQILYGLLLVIMMRYRPQGLAGDYSFE